MWCRAGNHSRELQYLRPKATWAVSGPGVCITKIIVLQTTQKHIVLRLTNFSSVAVNTKFMSTLCCVKKKAMKNITFLQFLDSTVQSVTVLLELWTNVPFFFCELLQKSLIITVNAWHPAVTSHELQLMPNIKV